MLRDAIYGTMMAKTATAMLIVDATPTDLAVKVDRLYGCTHWDDDTLVGC
jgi:hypothetical protein